MGLIDQMGATADPDVVERTVRRITEIFRDDVPATFLVPGNWTIIAHKRIRGLSSPWWSDPIAQMEDLWLEE